MTNKKMCGIPSNLVGCCDMEWGHEGDMHANSGDGFYARDYDAEHRRRQKSTRRKGSRS